MNIAVYSDKFSGTLSASEVIGTVKELFQNNSIEAAYFPVTDGGEDSTKIFKEYGITVKQSLKIKDLVGNEKVIELLDVSGDDNPRSANMKRMPEIKYNDAAKFDDIILLYFFFLFPVHLQHSLCYQKTSKYIYCSKKYCYKSKHV